MGKNQNQEKIRRRMPFFRRQFVVNRKAQYSLLGWIIAIAVFFSIYSVGSMMTWRWLTGDAASGSNIPAGRILVAALLIWGGGLFVLTVSIFVVNYVSNRLVGPVWRLERHMKGIIDGDLPSPIRCREKDQLELFSTYNQLIEKLPKKLD